MPRWPPRYGGQGEVLRGGRGGPKEQVVHELLVRAGQGSQCLGQGKGDENIGPRQGQLALRVEPSGGVEVWARGTVAIFAGMVAIRQFPAIGALVDTAAQGFWAAWRNVLHGDQVTWGYPMAATGAIIGPMESEDIGPLDHASSPEPIRGLA
jgi:hypothetical protein